MSSDLRDKLRRLGVHKGASALHPRRNQVGVEEGGIESLVDGHLVDTPYGPTFLHEETYPADHLHGGHTLGELLGLSPAIAAQMANDPALAKVDLHRIVFLDTETTGLAGGTGTLVFLVGLGAFQPPTSNPQSLISNLQPPTSTFRIPPSSPALDAQRRGFIIRQFFLRSPAEEPAMLHALAEWLDSFDAVVSFNGRGFDLPLLHARFTLARMQPRLLRAPHLDLLPPARRMWRGRLPSCALPSLEQHVLDVQREQADVPGFLIPDMYLRYLRSGDAGEMPRVMYHNAIDVLSMVSLSTRLMSLLASANSMDSPGRPGAGDWLALGKWHDALGRIAEAEAALRACLAALPDPATRTAALHRLGLLLKRLDRREEAVRVWEALSDSNTWEGVAACVELAKHYEWRAANVDRAIVWTRQAIAIAGGSFPASARDELHAELAHRMARLERKSKEV